MGFRLFNRDIQVSLDRSDTSYKFPSMTGRYQIRGGSVAGLVYVRQCIVFPNFPYRP